MILKALLSRSIFDTMIAMFDKYGEIVSIIKRSNNAA
jgi:hypothetical protein